jgi:hypothetical protein
MHLASSKWSPKRRVAYIHVGRHPSSGRCVQHTARATLVLAFWQIYDNAIPIMCGTSQELLICSILTLTNAEYKDSALSPAALEQAP